MRLLLSAALAALGSLTALPAPPPQTRVEPNYAQNVAPLLKARCVACHQEGGSAPFSLSTYGQAKRWSTMSLQVVGARTMPPWKPSEKGVFHDENRMTEDEIGILKAWDKAGRPKGPEPASAADHEDEAPIEAVGEPDKTLQPARPYVVAAGSEEVYRYFVVRNPYKEAKWLRQVDLKPGNPRVVHHMTAFLDASGVAGRIATGGDGQEGYTSSHGGRFMPSAILGFWAPGMRPRPMPEGTAMELPPGACIVVQVHYVSTGKAEADRWSLGLRLADGPPQRAMIAGMLERKRLEIPAGAAAYEAVEEETLPMDSTLWALMPHAHRLARRMVAEAILPDGSRRPLISIADWDPAWQSLYWFKEAVHLPKGTRVRFAVTYDNSEANPRNPSQPPQKVRAGETTRDEMMLLALLWTRD